MSEGQVNSSEPMTRYDSLRYVLKGIEKGIEYKELYNIQLDITRHQDSIIVMYKNRPDVVVEKVKKETNWIVVTAVSCLALLLNWTVYLLFTK